LFAWLEEKAMKDRELWSSFLFLFHFGVVEYMSSIYPAIKELQSFYPEVKRKVSFAKIHSGG